MFLLPCAIGQGGSGTGIKRDEEQGRPWFEEGVGMAYEMPIGGTEQRGFYPGELDAEYDHDFQRRLEEHLGSDMNLTDNTHSTSLLGLEGMNPRTLDLDLSLFELGVDEYGLPMIHDPLGLLST